MNDKPAFDRLSEFLAGETPEQIPNLQEEIRSEARPQNEEGQDPPHIESREATTAAPIDAQAADAISAAIVDFLDSTFQISGNHLYPRFILEPGDDETLSKLNTKIRINCPPLDSSQVIREATEENPSLADVLLRYEKTSQAIKKAGLTQTEKDSLIRPLSGLVTKVFFPSDGAGNNVFPCICVVMAPRIMPFSPGFGDFLTGLTGKAKE